MYYTKSDGSRVKIIKSDAMDKLSAKLDIMDSLEILTMEESDNCWLWEDGKDETEYLNETNIESLWKKKGMPEIQSRYDTKSDDAQKIYFVEMPIL